MRKYITSIVLLFLGIVLLESYMCTKKNNRVGDSTVHIR